jgi:PBSX family phage terminase large subunit
VAKLTEKQKRFCDYYIELGNATQAAIKAGYSIKSAKQTAVENLAKPYLRATIDERLAELESKRIAGADEVLQYLTDVLRGESTATELVVEGIGVGTSEAREFEKTPDTKEKLKAAELLGKRYGSFVDPITREKTKADAERARVEAELKKKELETEDAEDDYRGLPAELFAPAYAIAHHSIIRHEYLEYVFEGGRGSAKSSFVGLEIIDILMKSDNLHAIAMRRVGNTLRNSVFTQLQWAIETMGLEEQWKSTVSPLELTRKKTGQKIFFRGADEPEKIKSIKTKFGYIGVAWFEELDQFDGMESVRKIEQSVIRGGDSAYIFKSFNPPKSANNWANKYIRIPKTNRLVTHTDYKDVPADWLGKPFLDEAEFLQEVNPVAYENEYLGVANGSGGAVFDNVVLTEITDAEIAQFDRIYNGADWGWYPDPFHFTRMHFDAARRMLYIFFEYRANKQSNQETSDALLKMGIGLDEPIIADSAEPKSVSDWKSYGRYVRGAEKGPDSVAYSMKWLQSLAQIVIDPARCPKTADEFVGYEYERDKDGEVISGYPDKDNHAIDAVRYGLNRVWKRRGQ